MEDVLTLITNLFIGGLFAVEISPLKISPLKYIGRMLNRELLDRISYIEKEVVDGKVAAMRTEILDFSNSTRNGRKHNFEEWEHIIETLGKYERICNKHNIENNKFPMNARYLRDKYHKLSMDGSFENEKKNGELLEIE